MPRIDRIRLTHDQDRRTKLTEAQVAQMRALYAEGVTKAELGRRFGVTCVCAAYNVDEKLRERDREKTRAYNRARPKRPTEECTAYMRDLRNYKRKLLIEKKESEGKA